MCASYADTPPLGAPVSGVGIGVVKSKALGFVQLCEGDRLRFYETLFSL